MYKDKKNVQTCKKEYVELEEIFEKDVINRGDKPECYNETLQGETRIK